MRAPTMRIGLDPDELLVDAFAGGGGTSTGITAATGRDPDIAINHSPIALAMHAANHPRTRHYIEDVFRVKPREACAGRPVGLFWLSPDCTHHSRAKGGKPRSQKLRGLAWVATRWAHDVRPRVIVLENVEEFAEWGPLLPNGKPDPRRAGKTFRAFVRKLERYGYRVEWRSLVAADFGAPTTRRRLFLIARCDGQPIAWPVPTHGKGRTPWRGAHEVIDWSIPCPSIFGRKKPLVEATMQRIADGVRRYVFESARPFLVPVKTWGGGGNSPRSIELPLRTITASKRGEFAIVAPLLTKAYGGPNGNGNAGLDVRSPLATITAQDHHHLASATLRPAQLPLALGDRTDAVRAFLVKYYGSGGQQQSLFDPLHTVTSKARFGLVTVEGEPYRITDIGMRMLTPRELFNGNGFPPGYVIDPEFRGKRLTKTAQTMCVGNSVPPALAEAIVGAQFGTREAVAA